MRRKQLLSTLFAVPMLAASAQQSTVGTAGTTNTAAAADTFFIFHLDEKARYIRSGVAEFGPKSFYAGETIMRPGRYTLTIMVRSDGTSKLCFLPEAVAQELGAPMPMDQLLAVAPTVGKFQSVEEVARQFNAGASGAASAYDNRNRNRRYWDNNSQDDNGAGRSVRATMSSAKHGKPGKQGGKTAGSGDNWGSYGRPALPTASASASDASFLVPAVRVNQREKGYEVSFSSWEGSMTADLPYAP